MADAFLFEYFQAFTTCGNEVVFVVVVGVSFIDENDGVGLFVKGTFSEGFFCYG
jgi:hypothetical protein